MQEVTRSQCVLKEYAKDNHYAGSQQVTVGKYTKDNHYAESHQVTVGAQRVCQGQSLCRKSPGCLMSILFEHPL